MNTDGIKVIEIIIGYRHLILLFEIVAIITDKIMVDSNIEKFVSIEDVF